MTRTLPSVFACAVVMAHGQEFQLEARLLLVPVTVTDARGSLVNGLRQSSFQVVEERRAQPIVSFHETEVPCSLGIVFDLSGSMSGRLGDARLAIRALLAGSNAGDEAMVVGVSDRPFPVSNAVIDEPGSVLGRVWAARAGGNTALYDAIDAGARQLKQQGRNQRKALIVISDGVDNQSRLSRGELLRRAEEWGVEVHTLALTEAPSRKRSVEAWREQQAGAGFLSDLSRASGGLHYEIRQRQAIGRAVEQIGRALRTQYVIGYRPVGERDGKYHGLQIQVAVHGAKVHARRAYLSN